MDRSRPNPAPGQSVRQQNMFVIPAIWEGYLNPADIQEAFTFTLFRDQPMVADPGTRLEWAADVEDATGNLVALLGSLFTNLALWHSPNRLPKTVQGWVMIHMILINIQRTACGLLKKVRLGDLHLAGNDEDEIVEQKKKLAIRIIKESMEPRSHRQWRDDVSINVILPSQAEEGPCDISDIIWERVQNYIYVGNIIEKRDQDSKADKNLTAISIWPDYKHEDQHTQYEIRTLRQAEICMNRIHYLITEIKGFVKIAEGIIDFEQYALIDISIHSLGKIEQDKECCICCGEIGRDVDPENPANPPPKNSHLPVELPRCGHRFGRFCIERWLAAGNHSCPFCRQNPFEVSSDAVQEFWDRQTKYAVWKGVWSDEGRRRMALLKQPILVPRSIEDGDEESIDDGIDDDDSGEVGYEADDEIDHEVDNRVNYDVDNEVNYEADDEANYEVDNEVHHEADGEFNHEVNNEVGHEGDHEVSNEADNEILKK